MIMLYLGGFYVILFVKTYDLEWVSQEAWVILTQRL